jgi:hypothetical protein
MSQPMVDTPQVSHHVPAVNYCFASGGCQAPLTSRDEELGDEARRQPLAGRAHPRQNVNLWVHHTDDGALPPEGRASISIQTARREAAASCSSGRSFAEARRLAVLVRPHIPGRAAQRRSVWHCLASDVPPLEDWTLRQPLADETVTWPTTGQAVARAAVTLETEGAGRLAARDGRRSRFAE